MTSGKNEVTGRDLVIICRESGISLQPVRKTETTHRDDPLQPFHAITFPP